MAKNEISIALYGKKDISDFWYAERIMAYCEEAGLLWTRIDDKEPIRKEYSLYWLEKIWLSPQYAGLDKDNLSLNAHVLGNQGRGGASFHIGWRQNNPNRYNPFYIYVPYKKFFANRNRFEQLFFNVINLLEPDCSYIENENFWHKCRSSNPRDFHITQDVHWISYFSNKYMKEMNIDIKSLQWNKQIDLSQGTVFYICDDVPKDDDLSEKICLEYRSILWQ